jgi:hypothetical protein
MGPSAVGTTGGESLRYSEDQVNLDQAAMKRAIYLKERFYAFTNANDAFRLSHLAGYVRINQ